MLHFFIIPQVQTQSNGICNFYVILFWLVLPGDHTYSIFQRVMVTGCDHFKHVRFCYRNRTKFCKERKNFDIYDRCWKQQGTFWLQWSVASVIWLNVLSVICLLNVKFYNYVEGKIIGRSFLFLHNGLINYRCDNNSCQ
jgi:hypothetical protein